MLIYRRDIYKEKNGQECHLSRHEMQDFGNQIRKDNGLGYLAERAVSIIDASGIDKWVIDGIRNPNEITIFQKYTSQYFTIAITSDSDIRWERIKSVYNNDKRLFEDDDVRDSKEKCEYGQRVRDCYEKADIIISNNDPAYKGNDSYDLLKGKVEKYIKIIHKEKPYVPSHMETLMAMAYANSMRSSCLKRKVGALIVDTYGNIFSSGFNEVPIDHKPCKNKWGDCYRTVLKKEFSTELSSIIQEKETHNKVNTLFQEKFKILDYCRALHAEENAILNVARSGSSLVIKGSTLYTTTYPCNLCANKIVNVGIAEVVYMEPYPMKEAKHTLSQNKVKQTPFEGVTFNGYFRFMEVIT